MTTTTIETAARREIPRRAGFALSEKQAWGLLFVAPYVAIFIGFVLFPVGHSFWLARDPQLYGQLAATIFTDMAGYSALARRP